MTTEEKVSVKVLKRDQQRIVKIAKTTGKKIYWIVGEALDALEKVNKKK